MQKLTRRTVLAGLGALAPLAVAGVPVQAATPAREVSIVRRTLEVKGRAAPVFGVRANGGLKGLDFVLGEDFKVRLTNNTDVETLLHWHGLTPPIAQDGVPVLSQPVLQPGQSYDYDFPLTRPGTHWMHSHVGLQEQLLMAAPLIVRETAEAVFDEQEHVVLLHDFTFREPQEVLAELQAGGGGHAGHAMDSGTMDHSKMAQGGMAMGAMLNDITFDAYLANDRTLDDPEVVQVEKGGWVRLRIINGAAASNMWIDLGRLEGDLVAVDGHATKPLRGRVFPLAIAQRADIRLQVPAEGGAFPVLFHPEGVKQRTGIILASAGAAIGKTGDAAEAAPALDLGFESQITSAIAMPDEPVSKTEMVMLTGGDADYAWGLNGKSSMHDTLFTVRPGARIEVMMHNMTMMAHPMHLHGHYFKVVAINNQRIDGAIRDTVLVPPMATVTVMFDANNPGTWAFHCHHMYHMNAGMMGVIAYTSAA